MPDLKLNQIPNATLPLDGDEFLLVDQSGLSRKITVSDLPSGGNVDSVNGETGVVVLNATHVGAIEGPNNNGGVDLLTSKTGIVNPPSPEFFALNNFQSFLTPDEDITHDLTTLFVNRLQLDGAFQYGQASSGGLLLMDNRIVHEGTGQLGRASIFQNTVELNGINSFTNSANVNATSVIMRNGSTCTNVVGVESNVTLEENCQADFVAPFSSFLRVQNDANINFGLVASFNTQIEGGGTINNLNGLRIHYTNYDVGVGTLTGGTEGIQLGVFGDLEVENYQGLSVTYNPSGTTNSFVGLAVRVDTTAGEITNSTGIDINMGTYDSTLFRRLAINCQNGLISQDLTVSTNSNTFFDQANIYFNRFLVSDGNPITGTEMILNNFTAGMVFDDDMEVGPLGLGAVALGSVGNIDIAAGKIVEKASMFVAGQSVGSTSANGLIEEFSCFKALGLIEFGMGGTIQADKVIGFLHEYLGPSTLGTERWGLVVRDPDAENYLSKSLVIGGTTEKVTNSDVGLEIADKKALRLPTLTTVERDALVALVGMVVVHDDGVDTTLEFYNGTTWMAL